MALTLKIEKEFDSYQKIDYNNCFINKDGIYLSTIVYKNKNEREKEKIRSPLFSLFLDNIMKEYQRVLSLTDNLEKENIFNSYLHKIIYIAREIKEICYKYFYYPEVFQDNPDFQEPERIFIDDNTMSKIKEFGFQEEWYNDPILLIRKDMILVEEYKKQDFTLETFYPILKNIYKDENGNLLAEDDL